uniref:Uncharacterized protein n=1 Tax=Chromera velia CCMP2878 TaxID=1169474 RepID=A0A0G4IDU6_9ALVE|eukprot:Cvel_13394.t1-p1 / transcript=Cvel_13394.t1 / gene=Cvel_13394 / organism=Chromera_velia_CCMP2878 / gene_product=hypothetical protein / transcript_product=hypothetical protein / location=Cvel_scaffold912:23283-33507(+) / protein_length=1524 / sequence_SO=supercontig / SO=protein_coding / is_pseudo=false
MSGPNGLKAPDGEGWSSLSLSLAPPRATGLALEHAPAAGDSSWRGWRRKRGNELSDSRPYQPRPVECSTVVTLNSVADELRRAEAALRATQQREDAARACAAQLLQEAEALRQENVRLQETIAEQASALRDVSLAHDRQIRQMERQAEGVRERLTVQLSRAREDGAASERAAAETAEKKRRTEDSLLSQIQELKREILVKEKAACEEMEALRVDILARHAEELRELREASGDREAALLRRVESLREEVAKTQGELEGERERGRMLALSGLLPHNSSPQQGGAVGGLSGFPFHGEAENEIGRLRREVEILKKENLESHARAAELRGELREANARAKAADSRERRREGQAAAERGSRRAATRHAASEMTRSLEAVVDSVKEGLERGAVSASSLASAGPFQKRLLLLDGSSEGTGDGREEGGETEEAICSLSEIQVWLGLLARFFRLFLSVYSGEEREDASGAASSFSAALMREREREKEGIEGGTPALTQLRELLTAVQSSQRRVAGELREVGRRMKLWGPLVLLDAKRDNSHHHTDAPAISKRDGQLSPSPLPIPPGRNSPEFSGSNLLPDSQTHPMMAPSSSQSGAPTFRDRAINPTRAPAVDEGGAEPGPPLASMVGPLPSPEGGALEAKLSEMLTGLRSNPQALNDSRGKESAASGPLSLAASSAEGPFSAVQLVNFLSLLSGELASLRAVIKAKEEERDKAQQKQRESVQQPSRNESSEASVQQQQQLGDSTLKKEHEGAGSGVAARPSPRLPFETVLGKETAAVTAAPGKPTVIHSSPPAAQAASSPMYPQSAVTTEGLGESKMARMAAPPVPVCATATASAPPQPPPLHNHSNLPQDSVGTTTLVHPHGGHPCCAHSQPAPPPGCCAPPPPGYACEETVTVPVYPQSRSCAHSIQYPSAASCVPTLIPSGPPPAVLSSSSCCHRDLLPYPGSSSIRVHPKSAPSSPLASRLQEGPQGLSLSGPPDLSRSKSRGRLSRGLLESRLRPPSPLVSADILPSTCSLTARGGGKGIEVDAGEAFGVPSRWRGRELSVSLSRSSPAVASLGVPSGTVEGRMGTLRSAFLSAAERRQLASHERGSLAATSPVLPSFRTTDFRRIDKEVPQRPDRGGNRDLESPPPPDSRRGSQRRDPPSNNALLRGPVAAVPSGLAPSSALPTASPSVPKVPVEGVRSPPPLVAGRGVASISEEGDVMAPVFYARNEKRSQEQGGASVEGMGKGRGGRSLSAHAITQGRAVQSLLEARGEGPRPSMLVSSQQQIFPSSATTGVGKLKVRDTNPFSGPSPPSPAAAYTVSVSHHGGGPGGHFVPGWLREGPSVQGGESLRGRATGGLSQTTPSQLSPPAQPPRLPAERERDAKTRGERSEKNEKGQLSQTQPTPAMSSIAFASASLAASSPPRHSVPHPPSFTTAGGGAKGGSTIGGGGGGLPSSGVGPLEEKRRDTLPPRMEGGRAGSLLNASASASASGESQQHRLPQRRVVVREGNPRETVTQGQGGISGSRREGAPTPPGGSLASSLRITTEL